MAYVKADQFDLNLEAFNLAGEMAIDGETRQRELDAAAEAQRAAAERQAREQTDLFRCVFIPSVNSLRCYQCGKTREQHS
jgi:hypothetical protein